MSYRGGCVIISDRIRIIYRRSSDFGIFSLILNPSLPHGIGAYMRPLEIILTAFSGTMIIIAISAIIIFKYYRRFMADKVMEHRIMNNFSGKRKTVFLGDSLTDFYPLQDFFPDFSLCNRGIAGETSSDVIRRIDDVFTLEPEVLFLQIGINDFITGPREKPVNVASRIFSIAEAFTGKGVRVYVISLYPVNRKALLFSPFVCKGAVNGKITETNSLLEEGCRQRGIQYIDVYSHLADKDGNLIRKYTPEGLHLNATGYAAVTQVLLPYLKENLGNN